MHVIICGTIQALNNDNSALFSNLSYASQYYDSQIGMPGDFNSTLCSNKKNALVTIIINVL